MFTLPLHNFSPFSYCFYFPPPSPTIYNDHFPALLPLLGSAIGQDAAFVQLSVNATIGQPVLPGSPYIINTEYGSVDDCLVNPLLPTYYMAVYRNITCGAGNPNCIPISCKQTTRCATGRYSHPHCVCFCFHYFLLLAIPLLSLCSRLHLSHLQLSFLHYHWYYLVYHHSILLISDTSLSSIPFPYESLHFSYPTLVLPGWLIIIPVYCTRQ